MPQKSYGKDTHENFMHEDIAIIKVNEPYDFTRYVSPICVPHKFLNSHFEENTLVISKMVLGPKIKTVHFMGTGENDDEGGASTKLQHAELTILNPKNCLKFLDKDLCGNLLLMQFCSTQRGSDQLGPAIFWLDFVQLISAHFV